MPAVVALGDAESGEEGAGVALGGVTVLLADDRLQLGQAVAIVVAEVVLVEEALFLLHRGPEDGVPLEDDVEDTDILVSELVLLEDRGALGAALRFEGDVFVSSANP